LVKVTLKITNPTGLHARPAAQFVQKAAAFKSRVTIIADNRMADAKSILSVMSLKLVCGTVIALTTDGEDEKECIETLAALIENNFGEGR
jgi:phosphocarrier protein